MARVAPKMDSVSAGPGRTRLGATPNAPLTAAPVLPESPLGQPSVEAAPAAEAPLPAPVAPEVEAQPAPEAEVAPAAAVPELETVAPEAEASETPELETAAAPEAEATVPEVSSAEFLEAQAESIANTPPPSPPLPTTLAAAAPTSKKPNPGLLDKLAENPNFKPVAKGGAVAVDAGRSYVENLKGGLADIGVSLDDPKIKKIIKIGLAVVVAAILIFVVVSLFF